MEYKKPFIHEESGMNATHKIHEKKGGKAQQRRGGRPQNHPPALIGTRVKDPNAQMQKYEKNIREANEELAFYNLCEGREGNAQCSNLAVPGHTLCGNCFEKYNATLPPSNPGKCHNPHCSNLPVTVGGVQYGLCSKCYDKYLQRRKEAMVRAKCGMCGMAYAAFKGKCPRCYMDFNTGRLCSIMKQIGSSVAKLEGSMMESRKEANEHAASLHEHLDRAMAHLGERIAESHNKTMSMLHVVNDNVIEGNQMLRGMGSMLEESLEMTRDIHQYAVDGFNMVSKRSNGSQVPEGVVSHKHLERTPIFVPRTNVMNGYYPHKQ